MATKEQVRKWQKENREAKRPPPTPEQTRRELGWDLLPNNKTEKNKK